jgi:hypothetical protein
MDPSTFFAIISGVNGGRHDFSFFVFMLVRGSCRFMCSIENGLQLPLPILNGRVPDLSMKP